jgi:hypothetical protein
VAGEEEEEHSARRVSGMRVGHLAAAPTRALRAWARMLSMPYVAGCMYSAWAEEAANWVPKEDGNSDLGRRRPLVYYEVMRKISVGIKKAQVMAVWKENGWIDENNCPARHTSPQPGAVVRGRFRAM